MPTVHLSLPDQVYRQLKQKAAELGIQVTDVIKIYINLGLQGALAKNSGEHNTEFILNKIDSMEKKQKTLFRRLEVKQRELEELFSYLEERLDILENLVQQALSEKKAVQETRV